MKKKLIALLLAMTMVSSLISGCGNKDKKGEVYTATLPTDVSEAEIYVEPIEGLSEDFIKGMDISSVIAQEESGVVYYNEAGEEQDLFQTLADAGINYIRVRVWNNPYDKEGNGYGGGNNDVEKAAEIGKRAADYGMKLLVDFHYSDFWADPAKQFEPKEWAFYSFDEKKQAVHDFTKESLQTIIDAGADVGMVQIGNEINNGMAGETDRDKIIEMLAQGSTAVREIEEANDTDIQVAVHFTNIEESDKILTHAKKLDEAGLDYDVFGVSYYAYWHGTLENLTDVLSEISETYNKKVAVLETSYAYTLEDGDGFANSVSEIDLLPDYAASVQSQATCIRDIMAATAAVGDAALGVFYWEGAWTPVGSADNYTENQKIWEQYGSGWASSYASKYDSKDAGQYYGGCSWENQALFDFEGHPLPSLNVFKYVNYGATCEPKVDFVKETTVKVNVGEEIVMPETIDVVYNNRALSGEVKVTWKEEEYKNIDTSVMEEHVVTGVLEDGTEVSCTVKVEKINWVQNESFESSDVSMWNVTYEGENNPTDIQKKATDAVTGENSFHFWDETKYSFNVEQTISGLAAGSYHLSANIQGGDVGSDADIYLYAIVNGEMQKSEPVKLSGWVNWQIPEIEGIELDGSTDIIIGMHVSSIAKGWGTIDDFYLYKE